MKVIKLIPAILFLGWIFILNSCESGSSVSPAATVKEFSDKIEKGEFEQAIGCIATYEKPLDKEAKDELTLLLGMAKREVDKKKGIKNMELLNETIGPDGKTAIVKIRYTYGDGSVNEESNSLVKEEGRWKLSLQKK